MKQKTKSIDTSLEDNRDNNPKVFRKILETIVYLTLICNCIVVYVVLSAILLGIAIGIIVSSGILTNFYGATLLSLVIISPTVFILSGALVRGHNDIFRRIFNKNNKRGENI